jgi:uncharacterized protein (DUF2236 family)
MMDHKLPFAEGDTSAFAEFAPAEAVRRIWGSVDAIVLVFAGSAAEFALSKAVDWLFWTDLLPSAPIKRFFETVRFAQALVFGGPASARATIAAVNRAHCGVEQARAEQIPAWAYRHVLSMLIDYGERAHRVVFGPMSAGERQQNFEVMLATGRAMRIEGLPASYAEYQAQRREHLRRDIAYTELSKRLYARYAEHLGWWRTRALLDLQASLVPPEVARLLGLRRQPHVDLLLEHYRRLPRRALLRLLAPVLLPRRYAGQLAALDRSGDLVPRAPLTQA